MVRLILSVNGRTLDMLMKRIVSFAKSELWCNIHLGTGIVCASLPTYRPLRAKISVLSASLRQRYATFFGSHERDPTSEWELSVRMRSVGKYEQMEAPVDDCTHLTHV